MEMERGRKCFTENLFIQQQEVEKNEQRENFIVLE